SVHAVKRPKQIDDAIQSEDYDIAGFEKTMDEVLDKCDFDELIVPLSSLDKKVHLAIDEQYRELGWDEQIRKKALSAILNAAVNS
ncbi:MAG: hypothetical protein GYA87_05240, partial [Christensenellaceae bacterium]|nr:hypothetical protein [Christensenellaceae bacterium]